jgi:hypothetical protein
MDQQKEGIKRKGKPRVALPLVKTVKDEPDTPEDSRNTDNAKSDYKKAR